MKVRAMIGAVGIVLLGGCSSMTFAGGPGISLSAAPGAGFELSQCAGLVAYSPEARRMGIRSPAIQMQAIRNRITQIQHRVSYGSSQPRSTESWKRLATGEC